MADQHYDPMTIYDPAIVVSSDSVEIGAPASIVWEILTDLDRYGEWNPFCVSAKSTFEIGAPIAMSLMNYVTPGSIMRHVEYICAYEPEKLLSWELFSTTQWPYPARRDQMIQSLGPARCRYRSTDAFTGDNGIHVMRFAGPWIARAFNDTARALKQRAEAFHAERTQAQAV